ncbi:MAG: hypothetical protein GX047_00695 [Firmicutes bacterium]|nr:hypothetical protein [Bacillota bacterium]
MIAAWAEGMDLQDVLKKHPLDPGDLVAVCRQSIDLLRQILTAVPQPSLREKVTEAVNRLDRGVVRVTAE